MYSGKLLMMGRGTAPKHVEFLDKNKFGKISSAVGFNIKKFVTMHGHMHVKCCRVIGILGATGINRGPLPHWSVAHRFETTAIDYKIHAITKTDIHFQRKPLLQMIY